MESKEWVLTAIKLIFVFGGAVALAAFVIRPLWRMLKTGPDPDVLNPYARLPAPEEEPELDIPVGGVAKKLDRGQMLDMARKDPRMAANLVSQWLREKK